ncbi:UNVERIFIED_CONTAM: Scopoletin glucosyltransferase [Sesamum calycinum]|uniref:Scopoletin glucosyltransferase n=1 Tax=Sesamum calycinum TaxID=2727403 RepID=A0AAW2MD20_9LAMI
MSLSSVVIPSDPSIEGQHWCSIILMALQQPGPRCVSPLRKKSSTSPLQEWSSNSASQQELGPSSSSFSRAKRVGVESSFRAEIIVADDAKKDASRRTRRFAGEIQQSQIGFPLDELLCTMCFGASIFPQTLQEGFGEKGVAYRALIVVQQHQSKRESHKRELIIRNEQKCLAWLDPKTPNSVVCMCFRSIVSFTHTQLHEMAVRLEASGQDFIWVARKGKNKGEDEDWMPQEYEDRIKGRGLIIRDGLPRKSKEYALTMVKWPISAEQFYNKKLVMKVVKTGVLMGSKKWQTVASEGVPSEAVRQVMAGEEASGMRNCAKYYKEMARKAVEEGGSSYNSLNAFVDELSIYCSPPKKQDIN